MKESDLTSNGFIEVSPGVFQKRRSDFGTKRPRHFNICKICGKEFHAPHSIGRKYCSPSCAYSDHARIENNPQSQTKDRGEAQCANCGRVFKITTGGGTKFCSQQCCGSFIGKQTIEQIRVKVPRTTYVTKLCEACGKEFQSWASNKRVYCSAACSGPHAAHKGAATKHKNGWFKSENCYSRAKRGWREIGGQRKFFRSRMEANYARYLEFCGVKWEFESKTFWFEGIKRGVCSYTPDFFLPEQGTYMELKGWMDAKSVTKLKRMQKYYPSVTLQVIGWSQYKAIERMVGKVIPDWEWENQKVAFPVNPY